MTTVIATRKAIYADTLCTYSTIFKVSKLVRIGRSVYGFAGDLEEALHFLEWRRSGKNKPEFADDASLDVIEINKTGLFIWSKRLIAMKMNQGIYAIGSGAQYATGAMAMGATPEEALKVAAKYDPNTRLPIEKIELNQK